VFIALIYRYLEVQRASHSSWEFRLEHINLPFHTRARTTKRTALTAESIIEHPKNPSKKPRDTINIEEEVLGTRILLAVGTCDAEGRGGAYVHIPVRSHCGIYSTT
jgi:hypothetical protein